jgi:hypothetical protein
MVATQSKQEKDEDDHDRARKRTLDIFSHVQEVHHHNVAGSRIKSGPVAAKEFFNKERQQKKKRRCNI